MDGTGAVPDDGGQVLGCGVALVLRKAIVGVEPVELPHHPVAGHFGQDAGGGDRVTPAVALGQGGVRTAQPFDSQAIDERVLRPGSSRSKARLIARQAAWRMLMRSISSTSASATA